MPASCVGHPSKAIAAHMDVQGCREDGVHWAPGPYWLLRSAKYSAKLDFSTQPDVNFVLLFARGGAYTISHPTFESDEI